MRRIVAVLTSPPLTLAIVTILAYGLLISQLGFYWDGLAMSWIRYQLGPEAMAQYFSSNRPVWGVLYQFTTRLFPQEPIYWQIFALFWRWMTGLLVWAILKALFPQKARFALAAALLFLLYPGFNQQWAAFLYSHFFIVLSFFLLSIYLMLCAQKGQYWVWTPLALIFSALNLWMHEYFFTLEATRIAILWILLRDKDQDFRGHLNQIASASSYQRLMTGLRLWTPYLAVFAAAVLSRLFIFNNQIYEIGGERAATTPSDMLTTIPASLWRVTVSAWAQAFQLPDLATDGPRTTLAYGAVALVTYGLVLLALFWDQAQRFERSSKSELFWVMGLGFFSLVVAGWPFWLTGVPVSLGFPANRATLSFMLGASLLFGSLISLLPYRLDGVLITVLIALAAGRQFLWSNEYRRDWNAQKNLFWQMTWRAPGLEPGTMVLMNEELKFYADNSIGAALNWIYAGGNDSDRIDYVLFYPTNRLGGALPGLQPGQPVTYDYLAGQFEGSTSRTVVFYYSPPGCLRLLDPEIDPYNRLIPGDSSLREAAELSSFTLISDDGVNAVLPDIYDPEPAYGWCYYFQQAELARQSNDWKRVVELADTAFALGEYPDDPLERFVYIEGYAHAGEWEKAVEYSEISYQVSKNVVGPLLCKLWERIALNSPNEPEKDEYVIQAKTLFVCNP